MFKFIFWDIKPGLTGHKNSKITHNIIIILLATIFLIFSPVAIWKAASCVQTFISQSYDRSPVGITNHDGYVALRYMHMTENRYGMERFARPNIIKFHNYLLEWKFYRSILTPKKWSCQFLTWNLSKKNPKMAVNGAGLICAENHAKTAAKKNVQTAQCVHIRLTLFKSTTEHWHA